MKYVSEFELWKISKRKALVDRLATNYELLEEIKNGDKDLETTVECYTEDFFEFAELKKSSNDELKNFNKKVRELDVIIRTLTKKRRPVDYAFQIDTNYSSGLACFCSLNHLRKSEKDHKRHVKWSIGECVVLGGLVGTLATVSPILAVFWGGMMGMDKLNAYLNHKRFQETLKGILTKSFNNLKVACRTINNQIHQLYLTDYYTTKPELFIKVFEQLEEDWKKQIIKGLLSKKSNEQIDNWLEVNYLKLVEEVGMDNYLVKEELF